MEESQRHDLWAKLDRQRSESNARDLPSIMDKARADGASLRLDELRFLVSQAAMSDSFVCPNFLTDFVISYLKMGPPRSVLDAWGTIGSMLPRVAEAFNPSDVQGVAKNSTDFKALGLLREGSGVDWVLADPLLRLQGTEERFDVVLGCPPWNIMPLQRLTVVSGEKCVDLQDHPGHLAILLASTKLEPNGTGFFIVPPSFFSRRSARTVLVNLPRLDLYVDAALALPAGTFEPATSLPGLLLVVKKKNAGNLFVGELTTDNRGNEALLRNLQRRSEGKTTQLGALVEPEAFVSFPALTAQRDIKRLGRSLGVEPVALSEIAAELNLADRKQEEGFEDKPNSVYLPLIGTSPAVTTLADLRIKPQNYVQIVVDPSRAIPSFVANSFNTPLGHKIRESISSGFIPKTSKSRLADAQVYLPSTDTQAETLRVQSAITSLSTQLDEYQRQLWRQPRDAAEIDKKLKSLNREDSFESWIESLPFPLASVLRSYHVENDPTHRVSHLLNFFEALSQFVCTVLLSGLRSDDSLFARVTDKRSRPDSSEREWFRQATFGGWNVLGEQLAKEVRRLLSESETRQLCLDSFGSPDRDVLDALTSKKLFAILNDVKNERNDEAHGGIVSHQASERRHKLLQPHLSAARQLIADSFNSTQLLQPDSAQFGQGVYYWQANLLMGSNPIFKKTKVQTSGPMETGKLHLLNKGQFKPIELLPFFRLMRSPSTQQNACYFYNRIDGAGIRWVSYHFAPEGELVEQDEEVVSALALLDPSGFRQKDRP